MVAFSPLFPPLPCRASREGEPIGSDFTNLNAGCHGPVPLETGARSEDGANHSRIFRRSITSRAITKARFVCSTAAIRSATQRTSRPFRGRWVNRRPLGYEPTPGPDCNRLLPIKAPETRASPSPPLGSDRRLFEGVPAQFPHNRGSLVSSRRATIREAGLTLSANLDTISLPHLEQCGIAPRDWRVAPPT